MKKYIKSFFVVVLLLMFYLATQLVAGMLIGIALALIYIVQGISVGEVGVQITSFMTNNTNLIIFVSNSTLLLWVIVAFLIKNVKIKKYMAISKISLKSLPIICCYALALQLVGGLSIQLFNNFYPMTESIEIMTNVIVGESFIPTLLAVGVIAPIVEEVFFRGLIFNKIKNNTSLKFAVIFQGLVFGLVHLNIAQFLPTFLLACVAAIFYHRTKSLAWPIALHMFYNIYAVIVINLNENGLIVAGGIILLATAISFYSIFKIYREEKNKEIVIDNNEELDLAE